MTPEVATRVATIAADHRSGAIAITREVVRVLLEVIESTPTHVSTVVSALCRGQPAMAPVWNACALALRSDRLEMLGRYRTMIDRAPTALGRMAAAVLREGHGVDAPLIVVTVSSSGSVRQCLSALSAQCRLTVLCAEGRPGLEGRHLAADLAQDGIAATVCTDAAVTSVGATAHLTLVGADAVTADWFINKCGTHQVAEVMANRGLPVYVAAGRDKFIDPALGAALSTGGGPVSEVWEHPPPRVQLANPYFERVPTHLLSGIVTESGVVPPESLGAVTHPLITPHDAQRLFRVLQAQQ